MTCIIVEGPDGAGKTTLIGSLISMMNATCFHNGAYPGETVIVQHYLGQLCYSRMYPWKTAILDRSWYAEPIYGAAMRNGADRISLLERNDLENFARDLRAVMILCLPPFEVCRLAWAARATEGKEYLDQEAKLKMVYAGYEKMNPGLPMMRFNYQVHTPDNVYDWIGARKKER